MSSRLRTLFVAPGAVVVRLPVDRVLREPVS